LFTAPYRTAVIGRTGRRDYGHGLDLAVLDQPKLAVVAVADEDPQGREKAAKRLNVSNAYDDYRAMLAREKPKFVVIGPRWLDCHEELSISLLAVPPSGRRDIGGRPSWPLLHRR
jgi:hypothetical protein